jgi:polo-like kinase 1
VYYNDSTKAILGTEGTTFQYIERRKVDAFDGIVKKNEPVRETLSLLDFPESLSKKVTLLKHFRNYLIEQQKKCDNDGSEDNGAAGAVNTLPMTYLKKWVRTKHAILFRLSNQTIQIIFYDQTEVLLTPDKRFVTYVDKKRVRSTYFLSDELVGTNPEMAKRLKYAKEILGQLLHGQPPR